MVNCYECGKGKLIKKEVEYRQYGILIGKYLAEVCNKCGEVFFDSAVVEKIEEKSKKKKALFIIAQEDYQDHEYGAPKRVLETANIETVTVSKEVGTCHGSFGSTTEATLTLEEIDVNNYNAIILVGGSGAIAYQKDSEVWRIVQEAVDKDRVLGAICISPTILAYAGVLRGKKATVWNQTGQQAKVLTDNGAVFVDEPVVVDGNIITANGPPAAEEFGKAILAKLS